MSYQYVLQGDAAVEKTLAYLKYTNAVPAHGLPWTRTQIYVAFVLLTNLLIEVKVYEVTREVAGQEYQIQIYGVCHDFPFDFFIWFHLI